MARLTLTKKLMAMILAPIVLQLAFLLVLSHWLNESELVAQHEFHAKEVIGHTNWLEATLL